jgi:hypothetical protein
MQNYLIASFFGVLFVIVAFDLLAGLRKGEFRVSGQVIHRLKNPGAFWFWVVAKALALLLIAFVIGSCV